MFQPQCRFDVHLKTGQVNTHIERSGPKSRFVQVIDSEGLEGEGGVFVLHLVINLLFYQSITSNACICSVSGCVHTCVCVCVMK